MVNELKLFFYYKEALIGCLVCLVSEENLPVVDVLLGELADPLPRILGIQKLAVGGGPAGGAGDALTGDSLCTGGVSYAFFI